MKLSPALNQKKRYVVFEIITEKKFSLNEIKEEVDRAMLLFLGQLGLSKAAPQFVEERFNPEKQRFTLKVNHKYVDELKSALILSKSIKNTPVIIRSITTSGTLKKAGAHIN